MIQSLFLLLPLLTGFACSDKGADTEAAVPPHRNLIMLSIDTLRRDHMGRYGGAETPFLDGLAEQSLTLDDHHACSNWTYGSIYCAFSGADGVDAGWVPYGGDDASVLPGDAVLLQSVLAGAGFRSGLVSTNGYLGGTSKLNRYYDLYAAEDTQPADRVVDVGLEMLEDLVGDGSGNGRWFLHLHFFDPHSPYTAPEAYLSELEGLDPIDFDLSSFAEIGRLAAVWDTLDAKTQALVLEHLGIRYRASIRFMDDELARLVGTLEERGALDDTLLTVWSDHGEQFYEYGELEHGKTLHGVEVDTFALFYGAEVEAGAWTGPTTHADLAPTTLSYLGLPPEALAPATDLGGVGAVVGAADAGRARFAVKREASSTEQSVDLGGKRLIYSWDGERRLFDLATDPGERTDRFSTDPDAAAMWALLEPRVLALDDLVDEASPVLP